MLLPVNRIPRPAAAAWPGGELVRTIGVLGFGEAGSAFAVALAAAGARVYSYDRRFDDDREPAVGEHRPAHPEVEFCGLAELLSAADIVLSTVTTDAALEAAAACLPGLGPGQVYCDLNSTSPRVKRELDMLLAASGASFVEGAILGAIGVSGARTRILLGGGGARSLSAELNALGLDTLAYSDEIGKASAFKMLRSVFSKGLEALLVEFLMAGRRAGLEDHLWREVSELMDGEGFDNVARNWVCSHAVAHERRLHEMRQVGELLDELGLESIITEATTRFFERSTRLELGAAFERRPEDMEATVDALLGRISKEQDA
jgi:3-hydroxyisobutyrate dehydrogenase-like beta-hydroxyacid dehydrogenase